MNFRVIQAALAAICLVVATVVSAGEPVDKDVVEKMRAALEIPAAGLKVETVETSEIPGLYAVQFAGGGPLVYATKSGEYFISGDLYSVGANGYVNLGEQRRDGQRMKILADVPREDMIIFSPEGETRAYIYVYTDVTCFYCQKLHQEVPALNAQGVEVRYLAYPRAGVDSDGYRKLATAWCAKNPQDVLTKLKSKQAVPDAVCQDNPIIGQYQLGQSMGVRGTPAIVTQSGTMIPGYQSAADLMVTLGLN